MKRSVFMVLFLMIAMAFVSAAWGEDDVNVMVSEAGENIDNDLCFYMYAEKLLGFDVPVYYRASRDFTGDLKVFYDALSECIQEVAEGKRTSTKFTINKGLTLSQEDFNLLINALLADHPYELYWYDKTHGVSVSYTNRKSDFMFYVASDYAAGDFATNPEKVKNVQKAVANINAIVKKHKALSDREKLYAYKNEICRLVSYNDAAAESPYQAYGDAFQLIWVFDGDDATKVVCEGYSKAFKYLCDLSSFSGNVRCITVSGMMYTASGSGSHMWNIVAMGDGLNYLVDVTNCDDGSIGYPNELFLVRSTDGSPEEGYTISTIYGDVYYAYYTYEIDMFGEERLSISHVPVIDPAVPATCNKAGLTQGSHCSACGKILIEQKTIPSLGHDEIIDQAVEPGCVQTGLTEGSHCSRCGEILKEQKAIDAVGHTEAIMPSVEATCTETGFTEGTYCLVCNETIVPQNVINALGHSEKVIEAVAPKCMQSGLTEGRYCEVCEEILNAQEAVPALGHNEIVDDAVEATCTEAGLTEGKHCSVCGEVLTIQEVVPAVGHTEGDWVVVTEATEETEGLKEKRCTVCTVITQTEIIPKVVVDNQRLPGDVSGDGIVDGRDLIRLARYVAGFEVDIILSNASVNGDDVVDGRDLLRLAKFIGGFDVELE